MLSPAHVKGLQEYLHLSSLFGPAEFCKSRSLSTWKYRYDARLLLPSVAAATLIDARLQTTRFTSCARCGAVAPPKTETRRLVARALKTETRRRVAALRAKDAFVAQTSGEFRVVSHTARTTQLDLTHNFAYMLSRYVLVARELFEGRQSADSSHETRNGPLNLISN